MWRSPKATRKGERPKTGTFAKRNLESALLVLRGAQPLGVYFSREGHQRKGRDFWRGWMSAYLSEGCPLSEEERAALAKAGELGEEVR